MALEKMTTEKGSRDEKMTWTMASGRVLALCHAADRGSHTKKKDAQPKQRWPHERARACTHHKDQQGERREREEHCLTVLFVVPLVPASVAFSRPALVSLSSEDSQT